MRQSLSAPRHHGWWLSVLLHLALLLPLLWFGAPAVIKSPPPMALELWAGGAPPVVLADAPKPVPPAAPVMPEPAAPPVSAPLLPDADIKLKPVRPLPEPEKMPPAAAVTKPPSRAVEAKADKERAKEAVKPSPSPLPPAGKTVPSAAPPAKPVPKGRPPAEDLLAELDLPPGPGTAKQSQKGESTGVAGGSSNGVADAKSQYAQALRNRVRPYVVIPDSVKGNPAVVLEIDILPSLEVRSLRLVRSSGNSQYDEAVQLAVREMGRFPPLPKGADFLDYRRVTMTFRPKE